MAAICITGTVSPRLQSIETILLQAGMQTPRPVPKDEPIDILQWQHHVLSSIDEESSGAIKDPGRLWELLAGEIVLANLKSPLWGWCDPASIRFLDFWMGFAPEFKFLLVCQTPQQLLAERLVNSAAPLNVAELLETWKLQHQEMLRFHHRNPERSILIFAADALASPDLLVAECNKRWKLSLATAGIVVPSSLESPDALANFFANRMASLHPEIDALNREIIATATIFTAAPVAELTAEPQPEEILADYLALRQRLAGEECKFRNESEKLQSELSGVRVARDENARILSELQKQLDQAVKTKNEQTKLAHDRQAQIDQLTKEREQLKKQANELQKQSKDLVKERELISRLQAENKELQQENELLLSQLHQVQEELEAVFLKGQQAKGLESPKLAAELKEQQQENELLLLQLHQVQEELENYFIQCQQLKKDNDALKSSQKKQLRLQQHRSILYDSVDLKREQVNPDYEHLWFRLANLEFKGQSWSDFEFRLSCAHVRPDHFGDFPKLEFPAGEGQTPFNGWFSESRDDFGDKLELRFSLPDRSMDLAIWSRMTAADRDFVTALLTDLPLLLKDAEEEGVRLQRPFSDWQTMVTAMQRIHSDLIVAPATVPEAPEVQSDKANAASPLSYAALTLKREQVNPDYEHLWFEFANLSFAGEAWPHFEFRLSCAHLRPDYFGGFPKLEFPAEGSQAPFEGWFIEANDDFGDKLELRFSLPDKALDLAVWERVTEHDRAFMQALVAELPQILLALQHSGAQIKRPWEDWTKMAAEMLPIVTNPAKPKGKKKSSFKKMLRKLKI